MNRLRRKNNKAYISKVMFVLIAVTVIAMGTTITAYANGASDAVQNLADYIFDIAKVVGVIMAFFGLLQVGISISQHDASQRMTGILLVAGGAIIFFAQDILSIMGITT